MGTEPWDYLNTVCLPLTLKGHVQTPHNWKTNTPPLSSVSFTLRIEEDPGTLDSRTGLCRDDSTIVVWSGDRRSFFKLEKTIKGSTFRIHIWNFLGYFVTGIKPEY